MNLYNRYEVSDDEVFAAIKSVPKHYSASLVVDVGGTCLTYPSLPVGASGTLSGGVFSSSGTLVGQTVDMLHANSFTNLQICGLSLNTSGQCQIQVQVSDTDTSGNFTDPTSGMTLSSSGGSMPTWFASGGILWLNSGGLLGGTLQGAVNAGGGLAGAAGTSGTPNSGYFITSGFTVAAGFTRQARFVRANVLSGGFYVGPLHLSFLGNLRTTGSGGGFVGSSGSIINV